MDTIYLDYNATTPVSEEVAEAMRPYLDKYFGNPSSSHAFGVETKKAVENARQQIATLLNCNVSEIVFTSGGTESNNYAIKGVAFANRSKGNHIITSAIEHPAVLEVCYYLEKNGFEISIVNVDEFGRIKPSDIEAAIKPSTILISIMHANNEVGTIQPVEEISIIAKKHGIIFHCDAAQSVGKIKTDVIQMGVDLLSVAGHKVYAPKGIGVLYIKQGLKLEKLIHGADHERNLRAGTENVLEIVGLGKACEVAKRDKEKSTNHMKKMRDRLFDGISSGVKGVKLNGHPEFRLPNTLNVSFKGVEANTLLSELTSVAASAGAACHAENVTVSSVISAMMIPMEYAMGTVRFSTGKYTTEAEIDKAVDIICLTVNKLKPGSEISINDSLSGEIKLTMFTHGLGCACKLRPQALEEVLKGLPPAIDPRILVGNDKSDDASVFLIADNLAIVQTLDFFTPIVDDPYSFGAIAAANALSDIYAMGAKPLFGLNIVGFPSNRLPLSVLHDILRGAQDKAREAGIDILGGHTVDDTEPKYGMVVSGVIHPDKILRNSGAKVGDVLILTKPIGTGILATALKRGLIDDETRDEMIISMSFLNRTAAEVMIKYEVSACTDVTGFGLLGHLKELTEGSGVDVDIYSKDIPLLSKVMDLAVAGIIPGGTKDNLAFVSKIVEFHPSVSDHFKYILADAQTSGGLLISVPVESSLELLNELHNAGILRSCIIGKITGKGNGHIVVK